MGYQLLCRNCGAVLTEDHYRCPQCGGVLECAFDLTDKQHFIDILRGARCFWDYRELLPVHDAPAVSIGEGSTALVDAPYLASALGVGRLFVKNEGQNPSGTFKDRCLSVGYTKARELGAPATVIGSAGNAGAAAAAYAAAAQIPCFVMVPAATAMERVVQTLMYGGQVVKIRGNVSDCIEMLGKVCASRGWHNMTTAHPCNPFQAEGAKTIAYELAKQFDWKLPDWVIVPIGGGGILSGIHKGFRDLLELGMIHRIPHLCGVQEDGCCAVVNAFDAQKSPEEIVRVENPTGVAVAINDAYPLDGETALRAIYETKGAAIKVTAAQIERAQSLLGEKAGLFVEPASACTVAALDVLVARNLIGAKDSVACVVTGSGLKDPAFAIGHASRPLEVDMDDAQLDEAIDRCLAARNRR